MEGVVPFIKLQPQSVLNPFVHLTPEIIRNYKGFDISKWEDLSVNELQEYGKFMHTLVLQWEKCKILNFEQFGPVENGDFIHLATHTAAFAKYSHVEDCDEDILFFKDITLTSRRFWSKGSNGGNSLYWTYAVKKENFLLLLDDDCFGFCTPNHLEFSLEYD